MLIITLETPKTTHKENQTQIQIIHKMLIKKNKINWMMPNIGLLRYIEIIRIGMSIDRVNHLPNI